MNQDLETSLRTVTRLLWEVTQADTPEQQRSILVLAETELATARVALQTPVGKYEEIA